MKNLNWERRREYQQQAEEMANATTPRNFCACGHSENDWHFDPAKGPTKCMYPGCLCDGMVAVGPV